MLLFVESQQNFQEKRRGANQSNLLNIPVGIFAAQTTSHTPNANMADES